MISISRPQPKDAEEIHDMIKKSWYSTYISNEIGVTKEDIDRIYEDDPEAQIRALRNRAIDPRSDEVSLVAKEEEKILGFIRLRILTDSVELVSLYVHPEHNSKGIGTKLWLEAMQRLPKGKPITIEVASYTKAVDFYKKIGFVDTGERYAKEKMLSSGVKMPLMKMVFVSK